MIIRCATCATGAVLLSLALASAQPGAEPWQSAEIVTFTDFDKLDVKLDGKTHKAFLVGLRPIRETVKGKDQQDRLRKTVLTKLQKNALSARIITRRGEVVGLSVDTFMHHRNDFDHPWDPGQYFYCWSGWGAYNLNGYFLHTKTARFQDNFGDNHHWKDQFVEIVCKMQGAERAAVLIPDLGSERFATREAASNELKVIGVPAFGPLRKATSSDDPEIRHRAEEIIESITESVARKDQKKQVWSAPGK